MIILAFWLIFFSSAAAIFVSNRQTISRNFNLLTGRVASSQDQQAVGQVPGDTHIGTADEPPPAAPLFFVVPDPNLPSVDFADPSAVPEPAPYAFVPEPEPLGAITMQQWAQPAETRERNLYFTQVDPGGQVSRTRVTRALQASDSPMRDVLDALLVGPSAEEVNRGIISLIPNGAQVLSVFVRGNTAYISFNDDFQFNTFGVEGFTAQVRQVVWTATEFPNITDVQILIEGRRVDFLGEGIWIGSPIGRQTL